MRPFQVFAVGLFIAATLRLGFAQEVNVFREDFRTGPYPTAVAAGDLNDDGYPDLAVLCQRDGLLQIHFNTRGGSFGKGMTLKTGGSPAGLVIADFDGDGHFDIATAFHDDNNVGVYLNSGYDKFDAPKTFPSGNWPIALAAADFDSDGNIDLVTANSLNDNVSVLRGHGDGTFHVMVNYTVGWEPYSIVTTDFDNDGDVDILTANQGDRSFSVIQNDGTGGFSWPYTHEIGVSPYWIQAGDISGDGLVDFVLATYESNELYGYLNPSSEMEFQEPLGISVQHRPQAFVMGDLDMDGDLDLASANGMNSDLSIMMNTGSGQFLPGGNFKTGSFASAITLVDLDLNQRPEIVVTNRLSQSFSVFRIMSQTTSTD